MIATVLCKNCVKSVRGIVLAALWLCCHNVASNLPMRYCVNECASGWACEFVCVCVCFSVQPLCYILNVLYSKLIFIDLMWRFSQALMWITNYKSVSYQAAVWLSPAGGDGIESRSSPAPISPTSMSISYGDVGPTNDGLHNSSPWNESIGIGNVSYAKMVKIYLKIKLK